MVAGIIILALFVLALIAILLNTILTTRHIQPKEWHGHEAINEFIDEMDRPGKGTRTWGQWSYHPSTDAQALRALRAKRRARRRSH